MFRVRARPGFLRLGSWFNWSVPIRKWILGEEKGTRDFLLLK